MGVWWAAIVIVMILLLLLLLRSDKQLALLYNIIQKYKMNHTVNGDYDDYQMKKDKEKNTSIISSKSRVPKGSSGWPFIGETLEFIASSYTSKPVSFMHKRKSLYGKVFKTHLIGKPVIVSTDPEINKVVLQNHGNIFIPSYPKSITELFGESSILRMNGALHKRVHASIGRFLKSPELKAQITLDIENSIKLALEKWKHNDQLVYIQDETKQVTFEILVKVLISLGPGEEMELFKQEYSEFIKGLICLPIKLPGTQLYKSLKAKGRMQKMIRRIIESRLIEKAHGVSNIGGTGDAIDVLLRDMSDRSEAGQCEPLDTIAGNIIEMMVPGEDSVPMVMTLAVKYLSDNPLALKQLMKENMDLKRRKIDNPEDPYAWTDYMSLTFTQNVISETLRMANIINAVWRQATQDIEIKGYLIPKGWCVLASLTSVHMDEQNYENSYHFDPWRWEFNSTHFDLAQFNSICLTSVEKIKALAAEADLCEFPRKKGIVASSSTFTPFGGGQRLCPGLELARLEISIFLHHLVTTYRWIAEKDEIIYFPTVKMKRKLPISVAPCTFTCLRNEVSHR